MSKPLIWHDEERTSWTYCDRFEISTNKVLYLYRCYWGGFGQFSQKEYSLIGGFKSLEKAKEVAQYIIDAERNNEN